MASSRGFSSRGRGRGRGYENRQDFRDSSTSRVIKRPKTKCFNFDPATGERIRNNCSAETCGFVHPTDPQWSTARESSWMGPPPATNRDRDRDRDQDRDRERDRDGDRERDQGWSRGPPRDSGSRHERTNSEDSGKIRWVKSIDDIPLPSSTGAGGWGAPGDKPSSGGSHTTSGWGVPEENSGNENTSSWGVPNKSTHDSGWGDATSPSGTKPSGLGPPSSILAPSKSKTPVEIPKSSGWGVPEDKPGAASGKPKANTRWDVKGSNATPTTRDQRQSGVSPLSATAPYPTMGTNPDNTRDVTSMVISKSFGDEGRADQGWAGMRRDSGPTSRNPSLSSQGTNANVQNTSTPKPNFIPQHAPISPQSAAFSFGSHSRRPSADQVGISGMDHVWSGAARLDPVEKGQIPAVHSSEDVNLSSTSITPKPTLKIALPSDPTVQMQSSSLTSHSPTVSLNHHRESGSLKSPAQLAWNGHVEVLSQAVSAKMERLRLAEALDDRQRLISRITTKASRPNRASVPNPIDATAIASAEQKIQVTMATLKETGSAEQHWWPTSRGGVDYGKALSSLERDIDSLRQQLGTRGSKHDDMEVDTEDPAEIKLLRDKRRSLFLEVQVALEDIAERLSTGATGEFVDNQKVRLHTHVSRTLGEAHPASVTPGAKGLAKVEELRERLETLQARIANHPSDLRRRKAVDVQQANDMKMLKARYETLQRKKLDLASRQKKITDNAREVLAEMEARPILAEQVLERTTNADAQKSMIRVMVPKLMAIAEAHRTEDLTWASDRQAFVSREFEAWKVARQGERQQRAEAFLQELQNHQTLKVVDISGEKIEQRWNEILSVQKIARKPPAIRIPEASGSQLG